MINRRMEAAIRKMKVFAVICQILFAVVGRLTVMGRCDINREN